MIYNSLRKTPETKLDRPDDDNLEQEMDSVVPKYTVFQ